MELRWPDPDMLGSYVAAMERECELAGQPDLHAKRLALIDSDPDLFFACEVNVDGTAPPIELPDGTRVARIPGYGKWMWDGEYCGGIRLRWLADGDETLPPHVFGHIGYGVVPWKRRQGYASKALRMILPEARARGLGYVEITTDEDNIASRRVIEGGGGEVYDRFTMPDYLGGGPGIRYRLDLSSIEPATSDIDPPG